eukprot:362675-Chlamydomonas_euryale.AAC.2
MPIESDWFKPCLIGEAKKLASRLRKQVEKGLRLRKQVEKGLRLRKQVERVFGLGNNLKRVFGLGNKLVGLMRGHRGRARVWVFI